MKKNNDTEETPQQKKHSTPSSSAQKPRRKSWRKRLFWTVTFLAILGYLINGPVTRRVVHHYLNKALEDQGMSGSVEIEGSILGGIEAKRLNYTGDQGIQKLNIESASVDYQLSKLIKGKVDSIQLNSVQTEIDIAKFQPSESEEHPTDWKKMLNELRPYLLSPEFSIKQLDVTLLNQGKRIAKWQLKALTHETSSDQIKLNQWLVSDGDGLTTPTQNATLTWDVESASLDGIEAIPNLKLADIQFNWNSGLSGKATIFFHDAQLDATVAEHIVIELVSGELESTEILKTLGDLGINLHVDFKGSKLNLDKLHISVPTKDLQKNFPHWDLDASLSISSAAWENYYLNNTTIQLGQKESNYTLNIDGTAIAAPVKIDIKGNWTAADSQTWWEHTKAEFLYDLKLSDKLLALIPESVVIPKDIQLKKTHLTGSIAGKLVNGKPIGIITKTEIDKVAIRDVNIPTLVLSNYWEREKTDTLEFSLMPKMTLAAPSAFHLEGNFNVQTQKYTAILDINTHTDQSPWVNQLANAYQLLVRLDKQLSFNWEGNGDLVAQTHAGELTTKNLKLSQIPQASQPEQPPIEFNLNGSYDWPRSLDLAQLTIEQENLFAELSLTWDGKAIFIRDSSIHRDGKRIAKIKGKLPFSAEITTAKQFFAQEQAWSLSVDTEKLLLEKIAALIPSKNFSKIKGLIQSNIKLTGSPKTPILKGSLDLQEVNDFLELGLGKIDIDADFNTQDKVFKLKGNLLENNQKRIALDLDIPFTPHQWLEDDNWLATIQKNTNLKGSAEIKQLPLERFTKLIPDLKKIEGLLDARAEFNGTIDSPKYNIHFNADLPLISLKNAGVDDIKNAHIEGMLDQDMIATGEITAKINGGKFLTNFNIDVKDPDQPIFDIQLTTDHALIYRNDIFASRANANLNLKGTLEDATLSGNVGIVESLFYKDIDLIPIGVPTSTVAEVTLPTLNSKAAEKLPVPAPFDQWKLDLTINTQDPILLRGNLGSGVIRGSIKALGTLSQPRLDGTLHAKQVKAKLPFSMLQVTDGRIIFKPNRGLIPNLEIKGKSQVGVHRVNLYVYGSADNPKTALSSLPALPENEIMTLLATGTTNSGLANRDVATFKTLQLLLLKLKQRHGNAEGNRLFKKLISGIQDLDLKIGETNELTGDKYASATAKLHDRWYLTAQIDNNQPPQTRGLIVFALRFR